MTPQLLWERRPCLMTIVIIVHQLTEQLAVFSIAFSLRTYSLLLQLVDLSALQTVYAPWFACASYTPYPAKNRPTYVGHNFDKFKYTVVQKNAPTLADYNYDPVPSILIIFSRLSANDHKSCLVVKFSTSPHMCCHYTLWNTMLYFALITLLIARNAPTLDHSITSISVKEF